jgi:hypothetical protein
MRPLTTDRKASALGRLKWITCVIAWIAACDRAQTIESVVVSDSAGVTVFTVSPEESRARWTVSGQPIVSIASDTGATAGFLFFITGAHRFDDGALVVASSGTSELRYFSRNGDLMKIVGRKGDGPEEFGSLGFVQDVRDSLWVYDLTHSRFAVLDREARFGRLVPLHTWGGVWTQAVGIFDDGSILLRKREPVSQAPGLNTINEQVSVGHANGSSTNLQQVFFRQTYYHVVGERLADFGLPFGRAGLLAVRGQEWFYADGAEYRVERYDKTGVLRGVYVYTAEPPPVRQEDFELLLNQMRRGRAQPSTAEQVLRQTPLPKRMPAYAALKVDRAGNVWARPYQGGVSRNCWHVYQAKPVVFAEACLPDRFEIFEVGEDWVLGVGRDSLDVESVAVYRLVKASSL